MLSIELTGESAPASVPGGAIFELASSLGIGSQRARRLRVMVDELVILAQSREHGDDPAHVRVRAWSDSGHLRVEVTDQGIPVFKDDAEVPHELVRLGFAEFIELESGGRDGNISRCSVVISEADAREQLSANEAIISKDEPEVDNGDGLVVRSMRSDECGDLARLVYRCYGYNYPAEDVYFPDRMAALIDEGLMHSAVVATREGELVGHASLTLAGQEARIAEAGKLVVDPRYRSHGLAKKMADLRLKRATELKLLGLWTECVSNHPYSQHNQRKLGARETGIFLGIIPDTVTMTGIQTEDAVRGSLVAMFLALPSTPSRKLFIPSAYLDHIREIVDHLELARELSSDERAPTGPGRLSVSVSRSSNTAVITIDRFGEDLNELLESHMQDLKNMHVAAIYLDFPVSLPEAAHVGNHLSGFGFFFSALLPESAPDGDMLRLQLLNHEKIQPDHLKLDSDWGSHLLKMCVDDRERVNLRIRELRLSE
jgi:hypothetical protein